MYAIVRSGGRQHKVAVGDVVEIDRVEGEPGATLTLNLPVGHHGFVYVFDGESALVGGEKLQRSELGVLSDGEQLPLAGGDKPSRLLVVAGRPLRDPVARYGPFVMNTQAQIHEAIADFRAGRF